jgi:hypothetical protein
VHEWGQDHSIHTFSKIGVFGGEVAICGLLNDLSVLALWNFGNARHDGGPCDINDGVRCRRGSEGVRGIEPKDFIRGGASLIVRVCDAEAARRA